MSINQLSFPAPLFHALSMSVPRAQGRTGADMAGIRMEPVLFEPSTDGSTKMPTASVIVLAVPYPFVNDKEGCRPRRGRRFTIGSG